MSYEFDAPEDVQGDGGNYLSEPGTYHFAIRDVKEGIGPNGKPIDGFAVELDCMAGTAEDCLGKVHAETIFYPNLKHSDEAQLAARRRLAAFYIAGGVMHPSDLGKRVPINVTESIGRQIVMRLVRQKKKNEATGKYDIETKFLQVDYAAIFHVDDPEVRDVPKNEDSLSLIPSELRHDDAWFAYKDKKPAPQRRPAAVASASSDFSDL